MAEAKKKKTATVRTRVVSSDEASSSKKKTTKKSTAKATKVSNTSAKNIDSASAPAEKKEGRQSLRELVKARQGRKKVNKPQEEVGYFKGAWYELRQVRWPNRKATWSLTLAVILFTAFFVLLVLLLDAGFKYLFDLIIK